MRHATDDDNNYNNLTTAEAAAGTYSGLNFDGRGEEGITYFPFFNQITLKNINNYTSVFCV